MKTWTSIVLAAVSFMSLVGLSSCGGKGAATTAVTNAGTTTPTQTATGQPQDRVISGKISYDGAIKPTHQIIVVAQRAGEQSPAYSLVLQKPGDYTIANVTDATYILFAFMDLGDDMGPPQANEPSGSYDANGDGRADELTVTGSNGITGVDIILHDPK